MEQTKYWMWARSKLSERSTHVQHVPTTTTYNESWEEQAFAEDSAGLLGGCIWPPRSYSCSFCRREFRSAQALGGHMNVHRRDRARLKQSPTSNHNEILQHHQLHQNHHHFQNPCTSLGVENPSSQLCCSLVYNNNPVDPPNSNPSFVASPALSPSRVTVLSSSTHDNCINQTCSLVPHTYLSTFVQEKQKGSSLFSTPSPCSDSITRLLVISDSKQLEEEKDLKATEIGILKGKGEFVKPNPGLSLNLVSHGSRPTASVGDDNDQEGIISRKRRRTDDTSYLPFFLKPIFDDRLHHRKSEELGLNNQSSKEELDLELRLGNDQPKVK